MKVWHTYVVRQHPTQCCWKFIYGPFKNLMEGDIMTGCGLVDGLHSVTVFIQF